MPMPSVNDLQTMYGAWNPQAYWQAQSNSDLERQFREQEYARQQELSKQAGLETVFRQQNDPQRIEEQRVRNIGYGLENVGKEQKNTLGGLEVERTRGLHQYNLDADKRKALMQVTDDELKAADQQIEQMIRNPATQAQGLKLREFTGAVRDARQKHLDAVALQELKEKGDDRRSAASNATQLKIAGMRIDNSQEMARIKAAKTTNVGSLLENVKSGKVPPANAIAALSAAIVTETDPDVKATYEAAFNIIETFMRNAAPGTAQGAGGKLAIEGIPKTPPAPSALEAGKKGTTNAKPLSVEDMRKALRGN